MARPTFDYDASLAFARRLWQGSEVSERTAASRSTARDNALATWRGPLGNRFRANAARNDALLLNTTIQLKEEAVQWGESWARAVNDMNDELYNEAIEAQERYIAMRRAEELREIAYYDRMWAANVDPDEPQVYSNPARDSARWIYVDPSAAAVYVQRPETFGPVGPPAFRSAGGFLAQYYRAGDYLAISYIASIPGPPPH